MSRVLTFLLALAALSIIETIASPYYPGELSYQEEGDLAEPSEYSEDLLDNAVQDIGKRTSFVVYRQRNKDCIPRNGNCEHHRGACCQSSSCRCNLWGGNCRCQRMGLFQKWG